MRPSRRSCGCINCPICGEDWEWPWAGHQKCYGEMKGLASLFKAKAGEAEAWAEHLKLHGMFPGVRLKIAEGLQALAAMIWPRRKKEVRP